MATARLLVVLLAALLLATSANAAPAPTKAGPQSLRAFLFRADEPLKHEYSRTPAFAWAPVRGAQRYEFELATSSAFRENGIIYSDSELKSPVASLTLTLPWITGSPYSLYARVRAILRGGATSWSKPFGFNMRQADVPRPLASFPGLLRWTPVEGSQAYDVWLIDLPKIVRIRGNVMDEREFWTFHQAAPWTGKVRWRIRTVRSDISSGGKSRQNALPATSFGPWSPVYESVNPPFSVGALNGLATVSDVVTKGLSSDPAHRLMPAFVYAGNRGFAGGDAELYRVYVFTDRDCVNRVFTGAVTGTPAYAPRSYGPQTLPKDSASLALARGSYLSDGDQGSTYTADFEALTPTESLPQPQLTTSLPAAGGSATPAPATPTTPTTPTTPSTPTTPGPGSSAINVSGDLGAPVDLWDSNWPEGGYYWTVVPVEAVNPNPFETTVGGAGAAIGALDVTVAVAGGFAPGDVLKIGNASNQETVTVTAVNGTILSVATALKQAHGVGEAVVRTTGNLVYRDLELPQEVCASGRVMRFGKSSEPTLVTAGAPFASGLSPKGRLISATGSASSFYGAPLVAWTPALGADAYHVQWSKKRYPFKPELSGGTAGFLTLATSAVLPLTPGTWWYRVRGVSWRLPTNAQYMGWSDPTRIVAAKPTFSVAATKKKR